MMGKVDLRERVHGSSKLIKGYNRTKENRNWRKEIQNMPKKKKVTGTLNSKDPNPYEIAYKELWDKLPQWKKVSFSEDIAEGKYDWSLYTEFINQVNERAEELFAVTEK